MTIDASTRLQLKALQQAYAAELPSRIVTLNELWQRRSDAEELAALHIHVHSLAGSGATFGFAELSQVARQLELLLKAVPAGDLTLDAELASDAERLMARMQAAAMRPDDTGDDTTELIPHPRAHQTQAVVLLEPDAAAGEALATQLRTLGYSCHLADSETALQEWLNTGTPLAAVIDASHYHRSGALLDARGGPVPVVFVSTHDDFAERLRCVRAGGRAFLSKPVDVLALADSLDELTLRNPREPYRILIAEDTKDLAAYYSLILERAGMTTLVVTNPMMVMEALRDFRPDLVLMDLYMPNCNGLELAAVIRQQQTFVGIPIVFLSGETDGDKQLVAMSQGADDFLNKSISPAHLARSVAARVARSRNMRALMMRDSLTGLYNHTSIKEQLDRELLRAARNRSSLSYAMIDIDKFKSVNDNYGHPTGDRVLKSLSRYLKQRLRGSDVIGRYGGEEFAVILPDTMTGAAQRVLDDLRAGFSQLRHATEHGDITVTFSAGIAGYPGHETAQQLNEAADKALYQAKQDGRNRVVVAGSRS